jgi:hypothetical protein
MRICLCRTPEKLPCMPRCRRLDLPSIWWPRFCSPAAPIRIAPQNRPLKLGHSCETVAPGARPPCIVLPPSAVKTPFNFFWMPGRESTQRTSTAIPHSRGPVGTAAQLQSSESCATTRSPFIRKGKRWMPICSDSRTFKVRLTSVLDNPVTSAIYVQDFAHTAPLSMVATVRKQ